MLPDDWKLPYPLPLLPSEIKAQEEAEARAARKAEKQDVRAAKPAPLKEIKEQVLAYLGLTTTAELKALLLKRGDRRNLSRRDSWEPLLDPTNGMRWLMKQDSDRSKVDVSQVAARVQAKRDETRRIFQYRTNMSFGGLQESNRQAWLHITQKLQEQVV